MLGNNGKFLLTLMGVLTPVSAHAGPSAQPQIDVSRNFPAYVSAESLSTISPNPSEVISKISELHYKSFQDIFEISQFSAQNRGVHPKKNRLESSYLCYLGVHEKIQNSMIQLPIFLYLKLADFSVKIGLNGG